MRKLMSGLILGLSLVLSTLAFTAPASAATWKEQRTFTKAADCGKAGFASGYAYQCKERSINGYVLYTLYLKM